MLAQAKPVIPAPEASLGYVLSSRLVARVRMKGPISLPTCEVFCFFFFLKLNLIWHFSTGTSVAASSETACG